ncbi:BRCT domain-containing protein, partial [Patescibacteria group bacterium]
NKTFVLTGSLEKMSRDEAKEKIRRLGGNISSSVSKNTNFVVVGKEAGSKLSKAEEFDIKIIKEQDFLKLITNPL